jgi:hypothetical protein
VVKGLFYTRRKSKSCHFMWIHDLANWMENLVNSFETLYISVYFLYSTHIFEVHILTVQLGILDSVRVFMYMHQECKCEWSKNDEFVTTWFGLCWCAFIWLSLLWLWIHHVSLHFFEDLVFLIPRTCFCFGVTEERAVNVLWDLKALSLWIQRLLFSLSVCSGIGVNVGIYVCLELWIDVLAVHHFYLPLVFSLVTSSHDVEVWFGSWLLAGFNLGICCS